MYLQHFGFTEFPFSLTSNLRFFCGLTAYKEALNVIMVSLQNGEGFVKITGEVGTGKSLLCRKLLDTLGDEYVTVYVSNATLDTFNLQKTIAHELEITLPKDVDNHRLLELLTTKLTALHQQGKKVVIIVDEAHALSDQTLEGLRLLCNLETETCKLMQIVLVGQPELDKKLKKSHMRQLEQRIIFSYRLPTLRNQADLLSYLSFRLSAAGYHDAHHTLFSPEAIKVLLKASRGIPRLVNILCHKACLIAYGYNRKIVDVTDVKRAVADTESVSSTAIAMTYDYLSKITLVSLLLTTTIGVGSYSIIRLLSFTL